MQNTPKVLLSAVFALILSSLPLLAAEINPTWDKGDGLEAFLVDVATSDVKADLEEALPGFDLSRISAYAKDPSTLPARIGGRANTALWNYVPVLVAKGDEKGALALVTLLRDPKANLNPKVAYQGNSWLAELTRRQSLGAEAQRDAIREVYAPLSRKRFFGSITGIRSMMQAKDAGEEGELPARNQAGLDNLKTYPVTPDAAITYLNAEHQLKGRWAAIDHYKAVMDELIPAKQAEEPKKHAFTSVNMENYIEEAQPVVIGIFDSGTEPMRFNMYENPGEVANGVDDDGNGLVDDISGIVWDWDPDKRHQHSNMDLVEVVPHALIEEWEPVMIGAYESRMGLDTENVKAFQAKLASIKTVEDQKAIGVNASIIGEWLHGTHVAGLATAGNRFARVASFRFSWTGEARIYHERGPSDQELRWERQSIDELIAWINAHNVRVLNASLGFTVEYQEDALAKERDVFNPDKPAYGKVDAEGNLTDELDMKRIHARAVQIQDFRRGIWKKLFDECPDTLFVLAAGNDDHDVVEYEDVPTTITSDNDNLMIVGAVDAEGEWSSFTNFNEKLVRVFDHGVNAVSFTPTGRLAPISGTSQAAPNAAGAVAKLFALFPEMTPQEARAIIEESGDPIPAPYYGVIVNEEKAVALAKERHSN